MGFLNILWNAYSFSAKYKILVFIIPCLYRQFIVHLGIILFFYKKEITMSYFSQVEYVFLVYVYVLVITINSYQ